MDVNSLSVAASLFAVCGLTVVVSAQAPRNSYGRMLDRNLSAYLPAPVLIGPRGVNIRASNIGDQFWLNSQLGTSYPSTVSSFRVSTGYTAPSVRTHTGYIPPPIRAQNDYTAFSSARSSGAANRQPDTWGGVSSRGTLSTDPGPRDALRYRSALIRGQQAPLDPIGSSIQPGEEHRTVFSDYAASSPAVPRFAGDVPGLALPSLRPSEAKRTQFGDAWTDTDREFAAFNPTLIDLENVILPYSAPANLESPNVTLAAALRSVPDTSTPASQAFPASGESRRPTTPTLPTPPIPSTWTALSVSKAGGFVNRGAAGCTVARGFFAADREPTLKTLSGPENPERYAEYLNSGLRFLSEGRFFDAEDRFTCAMSEMPDGPMAKVGRVHAQLGAGVYISASANLRRVLQTHPEVVGWTMDRKMVLGAERVESAARHLRAEIAKVPTVVGLESSLLLAYLGRITGDQAMTDEALAAIAARLPAGDVREADLYERLKAAWGPGAAAPK